MDRMSKQGDDVIAKISVSRRYTNNQRRKDSRPWGVERRTGSHYQVHPNVIQEKRTPIIRRDPILKIK